MVVTSGDLDKGDVQVGRRECVSATPSDPKTCFKMTTRKRHRLDFLIET